MLYTNYIWSVYLLITCTIWLLFKIILLLKVQYTICSNNDRKITEKKTNTYMEIVFNNLSLRQRPIRSYLIPVTMCHNKIASVNSIVVKMYCTCTNIYYSITTNALLFSHVIYNKLTLPKCCSWLFWLVEYIILQGQDKHRFQKCFVPIIRLF